MGRLALTIGNANFDGTTFTGAIGGGSVTIQTAAVPEPASLGLAGMGLLTVVGALRLRKRTDGAPCSAITRSSLETSILSADVQGETFRVLALR